jgi:hypothetical protein
MKLFSKKIAMLSLFAFGATFLMSFDQKSDNYGNSVQVYSTNSNASIDDGTAEIAGMVRAAVRGAVFLTKMAYRAVTPTTPELNTFFMEGGNNNITISELKNEKLYNLDK